MRNLVATMFLLLYLALSTSARAEEDFSFVCTIDALAQIEGGEAHAYNQGHASHLLVTKYGVGWVGDTPDGFVGDGCKLYEFGRKGEKLKAVSCKPELGNDFLNIYGGSMSYYRLVEGGIMEIGKGKCSRIDGGANP